MRRRLEGDKSASAKKALELAKQRALSLGKGSAEADKMAAEAVAAATGGAGAGKSGKIKKLGDEEEDAVRLITKFEASGKAFTFGFRGIDTFFGGLEQLVSK